MAANAYLTVAAGQVRQAISALRQEATTIRSNAANEHRQIEGDVTKMEAEKNVKLMNSHDPGGDSRIQTAAQADVRRLESQIADTHKHADRRVQEYEQQARAKESAASDLESYVSSLERLASDPRLS